jgi:hypothetical protein
MAQYLKLFRDHEEYEESGEKPYISHCIEQVHIHSDNTYYPGCEDGNPGEEDYDLDGGYYYP